MFETVILTAFDGNDHEWPIGIFKEVDGGTKTDRMTGVLTKSEGGKMSNRPAGQRVIVNYPHDSTCKRHGVLVGMVEILPGHSLEREFKHCTDIWEVLLDATQYQPQITRTYNEGWLLREDWYEQVCGKIELEQ